jgi:hypothetical protein
MKTVTLNNSIMGILVAFAMVSCQKIAWAQKIAQELKVFNAYKMPLVSGANGSRGTKITLKVRKDKAVELRSIAFQSKVSDVTIIKSIQDTIWLESYFYESNKMVIGQESVEQKRDAKSCILYYNLGGKKKSLKVSSLTLQTDTVRWK